MCNRDYNYKDIVRYLSMMMGLYLSMRVTSGASFVAFVPLLLVSVAHKKVEDTVFWVMVGVTSLSVNGFFISRGSIYSITHRSVFMLFGLVGLIQLAGQKKSAIVIPFFGILAYLFFMFIPSTTGWWPMISYLKIFMFTTIYVAFVSVSNTAISARKFNVAKLRSAFLALAVFCIFGSVLVMPFPAISSLTGAELAQNPNVTSLFKGVMNHSQWMGPIASAFGILLLGDLLLGIQRRDILYLLLFVCCPIIVFKTSSRTAMGTLIAGIAFICYFFFQARKIKSRWKSAAMSCLLATMAFGGLFLLVAPSGRNSVAKFVVKYDQENKSGSVTFEDAVSTRRGLYEAEMANFRKSPAIGNGFQVSEDMQYMASNATGLQLSAPIEKGVWISAVLEEGGIIGLLLYCAFCIPCMIILTQKKAYLGAMMLFALHVSNLGEFSMFSMSGCGGQWWMLVFVALIFDGWRIKGNNANVGYTYSATGCRPVGYNPAWR